MAGVKKGTKSSLVMAGMLIDFKKIYLEIVLYP